MYLFMRPCLLGCKTDKCRISAHPSHGSLVTQCGIACEEHIGRRRLRRCIQADPSEFGPQGEEGVYQPGEMGNGLGRKPSFHKSQEKSAEWGGWGASLATAQSVSPGQGSLRLQEPAAPTLADRPWGPPPPSLHRWPHLTQVSLRLSLALSFLLTLLIQTCDAPLDSVQSQEEESIFSLEYYSTLTCVLDTDSLGPNRNYQKGKFILDIVPKFPFLLRDVLLECSSNSSSMTLHVSVSAA